jgi:hypothetical protein
MANRSMIPPRALPKKIRPVSGSLSREAADAGLAFRYVSLSSIVAGASVDGVIGDRSLPPTLEIKQRAKGSASKSSGRRGDFEAAEEKLWGDSSELMRKVRQGTSSDAEEDAPAAVISKGVEIISQG